MTKTIKESELYKSTIDTVIKHYGEVDNGFEVLAELYEEYGIKKRSEDREEENNG